MWFVFLENTLTYIKAQMATSLTEQCFETGNIFYILLIKLVNWYD